MKMMRLTSVHIILLNLINKSTILSCMLCGVAKLKDPSNVKLSTFDCLLMANFELEQIGVVVVVVVRELVFV